jgi:hypothetical protein
MMRHLPTLILSGILGSMVLVGSADACHGNRKCATPVVCGVVAQPVPCVQTVACVKPKRAICLPTLFCAKPAVCPQPVACAKPAAKCGPKIKLCNFKLPTLCQRPRVATVACGGPTCAAPVSYAVVYPAPQAVPTPQR